MRARLAVAVGLGWWSVSCGDPQLRFSREPWSLDPSGPGSLRGRILTSNAGDDTLSVIDAATLQPVGAIRLGDSPLELEGPHHVVADPAGRFVYALLSEPGVTPGVASGPHGAHGRSVIPGRLLRIRTSDGGLDGSVRVDPNAGDLAITPDGGTLLVTHFDLQRWTQTDPALDATAEARMSTLVRVDAASMRITGRLPLCAAPHGIRIDPTGTAAYASCTDDSLAVVDLRSEPLRVTRVPVPGAGSASPAGTCSECPYALNVAPDASVWVATLGSGGGARGGGAVHVYRPRTGAFDPALSEYFCGSAMFPAFVPAPGGGYRALVPEQGPCGDRLQRLDLGPAGEKKRTAGGMIPEPLLFSASRCQRAHMVWVEPGASTALLVCEGDHRGAGTLLRVDPATGAVLGQTAVGVFPDGLVAVPGEGGQ